MRLAFQEPSSCAKASVRNALQTDTKGAPRTALIPPQRVWEAQLLETRVCDRSAFRPKAPHATTELPELLLIRSRQMSQQPSRKDGARSSYHRQNSHLIRDLSDLRSVKFLKIKYKNLEPDFLAMLLHTHKSPNHTTLPQKPDRDNGYRASFPITCNLSVSCRIPITTRRFSKGKHLISQTLESMKIKRVTSK